MYRLMIPIPNQVQCRVNKMSFRCMAVPAVYKSKIGKFVGSITVGCT
jgi:hypothetical protein